MVVVLEDIVCSLSLMLFVAVVVVVVDVVETERLGEERREKKEEGRGEQRKLPVLC